MENHHFSMGKSTNSMAISNSKLLVYQVGDQDFKPPSHVLTTTSRSPGVAPAVLRGRRFRGSACTRRDATVPKGPNGFIGEFLAKQKHIHRIEHTLSKHSMNSLGKTKHILWIIVWLKQSSTSHDWEWSLQAIYGDDWPPWWLYGIVLTTLLCNIILVQLACWKLDGYFASQERRWMMRSISWWCGY